MASSENLSFYVGDAEKVPFDIKAAEGVNPADLPTITGATYTFQILELDGTVVTTKTSTPAAGITVVTTNDGALATIEVDIVASDTTAAVARKYCLRTTWTSGRINTVAFGGFTVRDC